MGHYWSEMQPLSAEEELALSREREQDKANEERNYFRIPKEQYAKRGQIVVLEKGKIYAFSEQDQRHLKKIALAKIIYFDMKEEYYFLVEDFETKDKNVNNPYYIFKLDGNSYGFLAENFEQCYQVSPLTQKDLVFAKKKRMSDLEKEIWGRK